MRRRWVNAWLGAAAIGVANGVLREATYGRRLGEDSANRVSAVTAIAAFYGYFRALQRRWPLRSDRQALGLGAFWLTLTVCLEFSFGRLVAKKSWAELVADYDVRRGRLWPLVLAWIAVGPAAVRRQGAR